jgi:putative oxidoreductase
MFSLPRTVPGVIALTLRMLLGALFIYTGWLKAKDPNGFLFSIRSFHILNDPYAAWVAMGLPWLEIAAGAALVTGACVDGGLAVVGGMLAAFLWAILYSWQRGLDIDCGCFGRETADAGYVELVARNIVLITVTAGLLIYRAVVTRKSVQQIEPVAQ